MGLLTGFPSFDSLFLRHPFSNYFAMSFYRRRLPHWHPGDCPIFTFRLARALPPGRVFPKEEKRRKREQAR